MQLVLGLFLILFLLSGFAHRLVPRIERKKTDSAAGRDDSEPDNRVYYLADRSIPDWLGGLTAAATSHSGFMFTGMVFFVFMVGLVWSWLLIGWTVGAATAWLVVYPRLKAHADKHGSPSLMRIAISGATGRGQALLAPALGALVVVLLGVYASGQLMAARITLDAVLPGQSLFFVMAAFFVMLFYSAIGGLRSTIYSDFLQGLVMILALLILNGAMIYRITELGSMRESMSALSETGFLSMRYGSNWQATLLFIAGWVIGGFAELGQPHVIVRVLAIEEKGQIRKAAFTYLSWFMLLSFLVISFSVLARMLEPHLTSLSSDIERETVFALVALELLPDWLVGVVVAGFLAATISTADSQVLAASAAVTEDLKIGRHIKSVRRKQIITAAVGVAALASYLVAQKLASSVYGIVTLAWALISASFAPPVILVLLRRTFPTWGLALSVTLGLATTIIWQQVGLSNHIYEAAPGLVVALLILALSSTTCRKKKGNSDAYEDI